MSKRNVHQSPQHAKSSRRFGIYGWIMVSFLTLTGLFQQATAQVVTGHENFNTTLDSATQFTHRFQAAIFGEYFGRDGIMGVLNQPNCVGLRIYQGKKADGSSAFVVVGVTGDGHDLTMGQLLENGLPCPPFCDTNWVMVKH